MQVAIRPCGKACNVQSVFSPVTNTFRRTKQRRGRKRTAGSRGGWGEGAGCVKSWNSSRSTCRRILRGRSSRLAQLLHRDCAHHATTINAKFDSAEDAPSTLLEIAVYVMETLLIVLSQTKQTFGKPAFL